TGRAATPSRLHERRPSSRATPPSLHERGTSRATTGSRSRAGTRTAGEWSPRKAEWFRRPRPRNALLRGLGSGSLGRSAFPRGREAPDEVDAAELLHRAVLDAALDDLVAEEREDAAAVEDGPRVPVPVGAGGDAPVV